MSEVNAEMIFNFVTDPAKVHIIPESILHWVKFLTEVENSKIQFAGYKGIMFDTNRTYYTRQPVDRPVPYFSDKI